MSELYYGRDTQDAWTAAYKHFKDATAQCDPMDGHKCKMIAQVTHCGDGREFWIGELLEPIEGYPGETHCLHITTPAKSIVFGINAGDVAIMAIAAQIVHKELYGKPINPRYIDTMEQSYRINKGEQDDAT